MTDPDREERRGNGAQASPKVKPDQLEEEAGGEVEQKGGDQKRQAGETVEDARERIRRNSRRY